jgi:hypothetical protein
VNKFEEATGTEVLFAKDRIVIRPEYGSDHTLGMREIEILRAHFQRENDKRLGRWRYDETTVVYPQQDDDHVKAVDETSGDSIESCRGTTLTGHLKDAARAYFSVHPKPWQKAVPGEVWDVEYSFGGFRAVTVYSGKHDEPITIFRDAFTQIEIELDDPEIRDATRIYPKEES